MKAKQTTRLLWTRRSLALLLALVCLWMGGGVALNHTDEMVLARHFRAGRSADTPVHAVPAPVLCLACEWEQLASDPQAPAVSVLCLPLVWAALAPASLPSCAPSAFAHTSPRAPPRGLS